MNTKTKKIDFWSISSLVILALFIIFLVYPLYGLLKEAVFKDGQLAFDGFAKFFSEAYYYRTILHSFLIAILVTLASLLIGIPFAYFYSFYRLKWRKFLFVVCLLCTMSAPYIGAYAWIILCGNNGLITNIFESIGIAAPTIYGLHGIVLVQVLKFFPLVVIYMNGAFRDIDASLLEAAESMGCKGLNRFFSVNMALSMPTILAAALLVFMRSFADFGTPLLIGKGYQTFPVLIYNAYLSENGTDFHFAATVGLIAVAVTGIFFLIQKLATSRFKFSMSALHPIDIKNPKGIGAVLMNLYCYVLLFVSMMPQIYVIYMSFRKYNNSVALPGYTLENYTKAVSKKLFRAIGNTTITSIFTMAIIIVIACLIAYLVVRRSNVINQAIDTITMLPYIMPGAVVGIALVTVFSRGHLAFSGTLGIIVVALAIRRLPFTSRSATAAMMKISPSIEEAAISLGTSKIKTFVGITVPMMSSGIIAGAVLSFVSIITEMSSSVILYNNRTITLTVNTYAQINNGLYGVAAAFASVTTVFTIICLVIYLKVAKTEDIKL